MEHRKSNRKQTAIILHQKN